MPDRSADLSSIAATLDDVLAARSEQAVVAIGDSLDLLRRLPDGSVSLILTDPPYHSTKKGNIYGDRAFAADQDYLEWLRDFAKQWQRVLRPNGSIYLFCSPSMASRIDVMMSEYFRSISHITWTKPNDPGFDGWKGKMRKEALRTWYAHSERILVFEQASEGHDRRSVLAKFLREQRLAAGITAHELTERIGAYGAVNHGGAVSNWETGRNIPSREQYNSIVDVFLSTGRVSTMPLYEDIVRPFSVSNSVEFTDVWTFPGVRPYRGKHPAEKPLALLQHVIEAATYENDVVLDCFAGSGSTAVAALTLNRRSVAMEVERPLGSRIAAKVQALEAVLDSTDDASHIARVVEALLSGRRYDAQLPL